MQLKDIKDGMIIIQGNGKKYCKVGEFFVGIDGYNSIARFNEDMTHGTGRNHGNNIYSVYKPAFPSLGINSLLDDFELLWERESETDTYL